MTVTYTADVANASSFGCFWKILLRYKGSVYKLIWRELLAYLALYFAINMAYSHGFNMDQRRTFEKFKIFCGKQIESIPLTFVLGFYVTLIVKRWWDQYWVLPLPDSLALYISASIHGQDDRARILRRTIMRYAMLSFIIMLQRISVRVKKRFPTLQHLVDAGMMTTSEKKIFDALEEKTSVGKFWVPCIWASNLVNRARLEERIRSDHMLQTILMELSEFRRKLGLLVIYDHISVPLVYTQVVTLAVYTYFVAALIGKQRVTPEDPMIRQLTNWDIELDLYFPIFLSLQFVFYIGWLKVAETLINPFGEDDDDYEINWLIDRHIQVSYMVVDEIHDDHPELLKDTYWDQVIPAQLPYNIASNQFRRFEPQGSTAAMFIKDTDSIYGHLQTPRRGSRFQDGGSGDGNYEILGGTQEPSPNGGRKNWFQRQVPRLGNSNHNNKIDVETQNTAGNHFSFYERIMHRRNTPTNTNLPAFPPVLQTFSRDRLNVPREERSVGNQNPNAIPKDPHKWLKELNQYPTPPLIQEYQASSVPKFSFSKPDYDAYIHARTLQKDSVDRERNYMSVGPKMNRRFQQEKTPLNPKDELEKFRTNDQEGVTHFNQGFEEGPDDLDKREDAITNETSCAEKGNQCESEERQSEPEPPMNSNLKHTKPDHCEVFV